MRCSTVPDPIADAGLLCIAPPLNHTFARIRGLAGRLGLDCDQASETLLTIRLEPKTLAGLADGLEATLSPAELRDSMSLVIAAGSSPSIADLGAMKPLSILVARVRGDWFSELLRESRLISHFQPIVRVDAPGSVFAHECLLRGVSADGSLIPPGRLYQVARDADLLFSLDRAARLAAIRSAAARGLDGEDSYLFINFNPSAIYDPKYCLASTLAEIGRTSFRPERVVFEIVESDQIRDSDHLRRITDHYREAGFKVALDDLGSGYGSLTLLGSLRPDFVKLDMELIRGVDADPYKAAIVSKLLELARGLGIESVAEGIETDAEWSWIRAQGADYAQGFFFGRPAASPTPPRLACDPLAVPAIS